MKANNIWVFGFYLCLFLDKVSLKKCGCSLVNFLVNCANHFYCFTSDVKVYFFIFKSCYYNINYRSCNKLLFWVNTFSALIVRKQDTDSTKSNDLERDKKNSLCLMRQLNNGCLLLCIVSRRRGRRRRNWFNCLKSWKWNCMYWTCITFQNSNFWLDDLFYFNKLIINSCFVIKYVKA